MRRDVVASMVVVTSLVLVPPPAAEARERQPGEHSVQLSGTWSPLDGAYALRVEYDSGTTPGVFQAMLVHAQPSGTLLMSQHSPHARLSQKLGQKFSGALMSVNASLDQFAHSALLPYDPRGQNDNRITVTLIRNGESILLANGRVNVEDFSFTTYFRPEYLGRDALGESPRLMKRFDFVQQSCGAEQIEHCCSGTNCPKQCTCCDGPGFFCDLINCTEPECRDISP